jgi:hypothetical protein
MSKKVSLLSGEGERNEGIRGSDWLRG